MSSSLHSANLTAILFIHSQCNYNVIELFWFVIALFGIYKEALNQSDYRNTNRDGLPAVNVAE